MQWTCKVLVTQNTNDVWLWLKFYGMDSISICRQLNYLTYFILFQAWLGNVLGLLFYILYNDLSTIIGKSKSISLPDLHSYVHPFTIFALWQNSQVCLLPRLILGPVMPQESWTEVLCNWRALIWSSWHETDCRHLPQLQMGSKASFSGP